MYIIKQRIQGDQVTLKIPKKFNRFRIRLTFIQVRYESKADLVTPYVSEKVIHVSETLTFCTKSFWINPKQILYTFALWLSNWRSHPGILDLYPTCFHFTFSIFDLKLIDLIFNLVSKIYCQILPLSMFIYDLQKKKKIVCWKCMYVCLSVCLNVNYQFFVATFG